MSIYNLSNKIKGQFGIDRVTTISVLLVIVVGLGSFGLGRLSALDNTTDSYADKIIISNDYKDMTRSSLDNPSSSIDYKVVRSFTPLENAEVKNYVASKNGKYYYTFDCALAKRIAPKNQIFFASKEEAEKSGYHVGLSCAKQK